MNTHMSIRKCDACGTRKSEVELLRLVKNKNQILIDPRGDLPGRDVYLCPSELCIEDARENNLLEKKLKTSVPDNFYQEIMEEIGNE